MGPLCILGRIIGGWGLPLENPKEKKNIGPYIGLSICVQPHSSYE